jgi:hypothetical protein
MYTYTQKDVYTTTQRHTYTDRHIQQHIEPPSHRVTETQRHRTIETHAHIITETQGHRDTETQRQIYTETRSHGYTRISGRNSSRSRTTSVAKMVTARMPWCESPPPERPVSRRWCLAGRSDHTQPQSHTQTLRSAEPNTELVFCNLLNLSKTGFGNCFCILFAKFVQHLSVVCCMSCV